MERRKIEHEDGTVTLLVTGASGAATLSTWMHEGRPDGVLGLHLVPSEEEFSSGDCLECEYLPGGVCRPDASYRAGHDIAQLASSDEEAAWHEVECWYREKTGEN